MLAVRHKMMLDFEAQWWKYEGAKATAIREQFGCGDVAYYLELNALIDRSEAMEYAPLTVKRLRRLRGARRGARRGVRTG